MPKYSLLFFIDHLKRGSGLENSAMNLCLALNERGHEVHVCCNSADSLEELAVHQDMGRVDEIIELVNADLTIDWGFFHEADLHRMGQGTHRGYMELYIDAFSGIMRKIKVVDFKRPKHQDKIREQEKMLRNRNAFFMTNSEQSSDMAIAGGANRRRVKTYHQTVDLSHFDKIRIAKYRNEMREKFGIAETDVLFLYVAHNLKLKNIALLETLFESMNGPAKLLVVGKRKPDEMNKNMIYAGAQSDMAKIYAAGDALLHPTFFDSCANVVLEAMSCSMPVIVSDTAGINEIVRDTKDGWVLSVRDDGHTDKWRKQITELLDADTRAAMGASARETAETRDFKSFVDWFENYLDEIHTAKKGSV